MGIFEELFDSGARHREDEKNRHEWMRDDPGDADPHRGPINLDSGAVQIRIAPQVAEGESVSEDKPDDVAAG